MNAPQKNHLISEDFEIVLREFDNEKISTPKSAGSYDVVIVGGGISGLSAAWKMRDSSVLLLDQNNQLGGCARLEHSKDGLRFASAGTCIKMPQPGTETSELLMDLDLWDKWQDTGADTLVMFDTVRLAKGLGEVIEALLRKPLELLNLGIYGLTGNLLYSLISGKKYIACEKKLGDPVFSRLFSYLESFTPDSGRYPVVPWTEKCGWSRKDMELMDSISLYDLFFNSNIRKSLPAHLAPNGKYGELVGDGIATTLRVECSCLNMVSAYVGLHFLIGYLYNPLVTFPGGNGYISERLREQLEKSNNIELKTNACVVSVKSAANGYLINFEQNNESYIANAKSVIWAAPKFAAIDTIESIPEEQRSIMKQIGYHDYCVANVFVKKAVMKDYFGGYTLEEEVPGKHLNDWCRTGACISANWMDKEYDRDYGVLTLLKPIARENEQGKLEKISFHELQQSTLAEITDLLKTQGVAQEMIEDIKIWRWSRGLVICKVGQIKKNIFVHASRPIDGIFFANQDSVGIGGLESAVWAGYDAAKLAHKHLMNMKST